MIWTMWLKLARTSLYVQLPTKFVTILTSLKLPVRPKIRLSRGRFKVHDS